MQDVAIWDECVGNCTPHSDIAHLVREGPVFAEIRQLHMMASQKGMARRIGEPSSATMMLAELKHVPHWSTNAAVIYTDCGRLLFTEIPAFN